MKIIRIRSGTEQINRMNDILKTALTYIERNAAGYPVKLTRIEDKGLLLIKARIRTETR